MAAVGFQGLEAALRPLDERAPAVVGVGVAGDSPFGVPGRRIVCVIDCGRTR